MPDCSGLYGPRGEVAPPNQNRGTQVRRLRSSTFHSFDTPQEPKMLSALKKLEMGRFARYNRFPPRRHVQKLFIFEIEFHFNFLDQKIQKADLKVVPSSLWGSGVISFKPEINPQSIFKGFGGYFL